MDDKYDLYIQNVMQVRKINNDPFDRDLTDEELLDEIHRRTGKIYELRNADDVFLSSILKTDVKDISDEQEEELFVFACRLADFSYQIDLCTAYQIHKLLLKRAREHEDKDRIIRELYYCGLTLHYVNRTGHIFEISLFSDQIQEYFEEAAGYLAEYESFTSSETRGYIMRSLGNRKLALNIPCGTRYASEGMFRFDTPEDYRRIFHRALSVIGSEYYQKLNPELPWEGYLYALHYGFTTLVSWLRENEDPKLAEEVYESACYILENQKEAVKQQNKELSSRVVYTYMAAAYHAKQIPLEELLEEFFKITETADPKDYSGDGIFSNLLCVNYINDYLNLAQPALQNKYRPRMQAARERAQRYLRHFKPNEYRNLVMNYVRDYLIVTDTNEEKSRHLAAINDTYERMAKRHIGDIMDCFLACHKPTYVHSLMIAALSYEIMQECIRRKPEYLIGVLDTESVEEVIAKQDKILEFAYNSGLHHDIGKCAILDIVDVYERSLYDEEFQMIKYHPYIGLLLAQGISDTSQYADSILKHHRFARENRGYPGFLSYDPAQTNPVVDIVAVADSMDAATDDIGRCYASAKNYARLVEELRAERGVRYADEVVELFDDENFYRQMEQVLTKRRKDCYLQVYRDTSSGEWKVTIPDSQQFLKPEIQQQTGLMNREKGLINRENGLINRTARLS